MSTSPPPRRSRSVRAARHASRTAPAAIHVMRDADAGGAVVVEALRVADVLEPDGEADSAPDALAAGRVPRAAGEADRVARELLRLRHGQLRAAADDLGDRQRARDPLPGRERVAGAERVQQPQLDRGDPE